MSRQLPCLIAALVAGRTAALHEHNGSEPVAGCVAPGQCSAPSTKYSRVVRGPQPGQQWNINGGFCGSFSLQQSALAFGTWISQDEVRRANRAGSGPHTMHGDEHVGYEVMPSNVAYTAKMLKLTFDEFNYSQPAPQAAAYKSWLKQHLVQGHPVVWFPICKGDDHGCYGGQPCPNGGHVDHVEPMFGIFSDRPLTDTTVYDDDWILHASDQDLLPYYRPLGTLEDSTAMEGNCKNAGAGFGRNEMYPCFDEQVTYGVALTGLAVQGSLPVSLTVDITEEPDVRLFQQPVQIRGTVEVSGLKAGKTYSLIRYGSTDSLPAAFPFWNFEHRTDFIAQGETWTWEDRHTFSSASATYYVASEAVDVDVVV